MKVIFITTSFPFGPSEAYFIDELTEMRRQGHEIRIVPLRPAGPVVHHDAEMFVDSTARLPAVSPSILLGATLQAAGGPQGARQAFQPLLASRNPRILAKNLVGFPKGLWLARYARAWGADHIHAYWAGVAATVAMVASRASGIPWSFTAHRWDIPEDNLLKLKAESARFSRFIARDGLAQAGLTGKRGALVLHMGVRLPTTGIQLPRPASGGAPVLLCAAGLVPRKGHKFLVEAISLVGKRGLKPELWLAGHGESAAELAAQAKALGITERVRFLDQLSHSELRRLYEDARVTAVVLPSLSEGLPIALVEAMGYGLPAIGTTVGGVPELLSDGAGLIVPPEDSPALAHAIEKLLTERALLDRIAATGRTKVLAEFAVENVVRELTSRMAGEA